MQDLRVTKTLQAIEEAFYSLRAEKDLEKIKIKELCEKALINKTTFYTYYTDIFDLSNQIENRFINEKFKVLPIYTSLDFDIKAVIYDIFSAFECLETKILFKDRYDVLMTKCEKKILEDYKIIINTKEKQMFASFYVFGAFKILYGSDAPRSLKMKILATIAETWLKDAIK